MENKVYKLGIIGFGGMAHHHKTELHDKHFDRVAVHGIYDIDPKKLEEAKSYGFKAYSSKEEMFADPEIDIVLVATTNDTHKDLSVEALAAGKHVLCEKPATVSCAELQEIMDAAKKYGKVFTTDQNRRTNKDFVLMRRSVEEGLIGKPYVIESRVEGSRGLPAGWRTIKAQGGGMMYDWGIHLIDQIMYMIDEKVTSVFCKMFSINYPEVDDNFRLDITFESGLLAHVEVSTNNFITHPRWYVLGTEGTLQINDWGCEGEVIRCLDQENQWADQIVQTKAGPTKTMAPRSKDSVKTIPLSEPLDVIDNLRPVYNQLCDAIEGKAELTIKPEQTMRVMKVMEAAFKSHEENIVVKTDI